jgi:hypothetical protein
MENLSKETKTLVFSKPFDTRAKLLYSFYCLLFLSQGVGFAFLLLETSSVFLTILLAVVSLLAFITAYRFGNKMLFSERATIDNSNFIFIANGLFNIKKIVFNRSKINNIDFLTKPSLTEHPLAGKSFDYLGFETQGKMINELHGDNRIAIDYNGEVITFGESLFSWHFEELSKALGFWNLENDTELCFAEPKIENGTV